MKHVWLAFALFALGCGSSGEPADITADSGVAPSDTGVAVDSGAAVTDSGSAPTDTGSATGDSAVGDGAVSETASGASLSGKVTRKAGTKPSAGGKGNLYIALFDGNPITDMMGAKLVARALIENVDMNPDGVSIPYRIDGIPPSPTERQVVAFLDDNKTASATSPAPDKGDLVTIEIPAFSGVKVRVPADTKLDLQLNAAIP